jgi:SPP1 family predicted phage head-tail adaptor
VVAVRAPALQVGQLDRQVTIESLPETVNTRGDPVPGATTTFAIVWARYESLRGRELTIGGEKAFGALNARWTMRYLSGVLTSMQINDNGTIHDITDIDDTRRREGILYVYTTERRA